MYQVFWKIFFFIWKGWVRRTQVFLHGVHGRGTEIHGGI
jgi:hypothetical protein